MACAADGVLVVDDDHEIREAILEVIRDAGYVAHAARDGGEALAYLRASAPPKLILLDLSMPGMDGAAFCQEQQKDPRLARIPVVILSAAAALGERVRGLPIRGHLNKPIELADLLATVRRYCEAGS
jgi:CheY-like chemotaxis protein